MAPATYINGLPLPSDLLALIQEGRWKCPDDLSALNRIFSEHGDFSFYTLKYMLFENAHRLTETDPMSLGEPDEVKAPGDIDPHL